MSVHTLQIETESCLGVLKMSKSEQDQPDEYLMLTLLIQQPLFTEYRLLLCVNGVSHEVLGTPATNGDQNSSTARVAGILS